jgi:hypothetical protein
MELSGIRRSVLSDPPASGWTRIPGVGCNRAAHPGVCHPCGMAARWQIEDA